MKSVYHLAHSKLELRQSLPLGFRRNMSASEFIQEVESQMTALLQEALVQSNAQGALQLISEDFRMAQQPKGDGHFRHLDNLHEIDESTFLKKRENMSCSVQGIGSAVRIIFPGNVIKGPMQIAPAFQFITEQEGVFKISDIPMLDSQNKIMLAKRLIRGGLLNMM
jgi:hypothetical protein